MEPLSSLPEPKDTYEDYLPQSPSTYPLTGQNTYQAGYQPQPAPASSQPVLPDASQPPEPVDYQPLPGSYERFSPQQEQVPYQQQFWPYQPPLSASQFADGDVSKDERLSMGMKARTAGVLCYLFSWVGGLVFFLLERQNRFVRFHSMQSIIFFGSLAILTGALSFFSWLAGILGTVSFIGWIVLIIAAGKGKYYKLPVIGEYAEKWAGLAKEPPRMG